MIVSDAFRGKRYMVLGLARSGLATVASLVASGAAVTAWDAREEARSAVDAGVKLANPEEISLDHFDAVVVSPGVPLNAHPVAQKARAAGVPLIGDIELFALARSSLPAHKVVGITGTNGKSTTTALIHHIFKTAGVPTTMGGNIGLPILGQDPLPAGGVYVLELSSYQIDLTFSLDCDAAVLLNITPDHLDRYDGFEGYRDSKLRLFTMQTGPFVHEAIVVDTDDDVMIQIIDEFHFPAVGAVTTVFGDGVSEQFDQSQWPALQGPHNAQNAGAAMAASEFILAQRKGSQLSSDEFRTIGKALESFPGLPHRMERIRDFDGVLYVNDSKATNADSTAPALAAYPAIHWIVGGQAKTKDLDACAPHFGNIRAAYTIGEAGPMFAELLRQHMPVVESGTLAQAVDDAYGAARSGETVLLSPACASFDQFKDFEDRGDSFRSAVMALAA